MSRMKEHGRKRRRRRNLDGFICQSQLNEAREDQGKKKKKNKGRRRKRQKGRRRFAFIYHTKKGELKHRKMKVASTR